MNNRFKNSWEISGLDEPMINPEIIPEGYVQAFDDLKKKWRVRQKGSHTYLEYFPLIHWDHHQDILP